MMQLERKPKNKVEHIQRLKTLKGIKSSSFQKISPQHMYSLGEAWIGT